MGDRWIEIPNWDKFQHYKDREPVWIKDYIRQLNNPDYLALTFSQRGLLHDLRLLYASEHRALAEHPPSITRALGQRILSTQLKTLANAGFVALDASPRALAKRASPLRSKKKNARTREDEPLKCPRCGVGFKTSRRLEEHLEVVHWTT